MEKQMIKSEYRQERNRHYRIIKELEKEGAAYCQKMLSGKIPGFLDRKIRYVDDKVEYYYDVTGKQLLKDKYENRLFMYKELKIFLKSIFFILRQAEWHLLNSDDIVLDREYIYIEEGKWEGQVCYLSGYEMPFREQLISLAEWLLGKTDHHDEQAVQYIYSVYEMCREREVSLLHIEKLVYKDVLCERKKDEKQMFQESSIKPVSLPLRYRLRQETEGSDVYMIPKNCCILGRSREKADVVLTEATISRVHAKIEFKDKCWYIEDMNSLNGTYVNRKKITPGKKRKIKTSDVINLGEVAFILEKF